MINRIKEKWQRTWQTKPEKSAIELAEQIQSIRTRSDTLVITGKAYGNQWRGVYNGALEMFPGILLEVPHYFSGNIFSKKDLTLICEAIANAKFEKVVFTGYGNFMREFLNKLHHQADNFPKARLYLIYHGSLSQHAEGTKNTGYLKEIIRLQQSGVLRKIGFMKKGLSETLNSISGVKSEFLITIVKDNLSINTTPFEGLNLGVFSHDSFRKNLHNQVAAALLFPDARVHAHEEERFDYFHCRDRFVVHPFEESYDKFLETLGGMTLNFYVTFSECYGMVIAESLSLGVPCLASCSSGLFDYDEFLKKWLVVDDYDNPEAIFRQGQLVLENRNEIVIRGKEYIRKLNQIAAEKLTAFLND